jgi:hypothetical protein
LGNRKGFCLVIVFLIVFGAGCSPPAPKGSGAEEGKEATADSGGTAADPARSEIPGHEEYVVTFLPAVPTSADSVRATLRSAASHREETAASWKWFVNGSERRIETDTMAAGSAKKGDEIQVEATVARPGGTVAVRSRNVRVANAPPRVTGAELSNLSPGKGETLVATASAQDPDGDAIRLIFRWRINGKVVQEGENPELRLSPAKKGDEVYCEVVPMDGEATGPTLATSIVTVRNSHPIIRSTPPSGAGPGGVFTYHLVAEDPDGDSLGFAVTEGPKGASFEAGTFRWAPPAGFQGTARVVLRVSDGDGGEARQEFVINVGTQ